MLPIEIPKSLVFLGGHIVALRCMDQRASPTGLAANCRCSASSAHGIVSQSLGHARPVAKAALGSAMVGINPIDRLVSPSQLRRHATGGPAGPQGQGQG